MARAARTFRIFVSSTFADLVAERNALQEHVFPLLRDFCMQHGTRFQAIDLRWGVSEEAGLDQQTINICLDEIERCRNTSPRPNFIVLLGDRYGWQPPPPEIPEHEFTEILGRVSNDEKKLLNEWYLLDRNEVVDRHPDGTPKEHHYYLKPRERGGDFEDPDAWSPVEERLHSILEKAARELPVEKVDRLKYEASATEQEIHNGAIRSPEEHVFCFFRSIEGLPDDESVKDYVNLGPAKRRDGVATAKLEALKGTLKGILPKQNVRDEYRATWIGEDRQDPKKPSITTEHIPQLCWDVYAALGSIIEDEIKRLDQVEPLEKEIEAHDDFAKDRSRFFTGRTEILERIATYVDQPTGSQLVVWGASGSGKSAVMARAAQLAKDRYPEAIVLRFIGVTPESSNGRSLLDSLCRQISRRYGGDESTIPADYRELVRDFPERLALASADRPVILFLDALDQLSAAEGARSLSWLPSELPPGVRVIVSTLPEDTLKPLQVRLPETSFVEVTPMETGEGADLLDLWLEDANRTLQPNQKEKVLQTFQVERLPLWLKLAFEEARRWRSDDGLATTELPPKIPDIIRDSLFARLADDANHGEVMVSRSLGYLAAAKNGLSEDEVIDVLSLEGNKGDVLQDFFRRSPESPKEIEWLPVVLWSRLFFDLEPYLTERAADGASLLGFYHRQLAEAVKEKYLAGDDGLARHRELAGYFGEQDLQTAGQPNLRKMSELPYQQTMGELWDPLVKTLTDFDFLERKATDMGFVESKDEQGNTMRTHMGIYQIRDDYALALQRMPGDGAEREGRDGRRRIMVTATDFQKGRGYEIRCPHCNTMHRVEDFEQDPLGSEIDCPNPECKGPLKVNAFTTPPRQ